MVAHNTHQTPVADWMIHPKKLSEDVYAARVLIPRNKSLAAVRIANLSDESFNILAGTELGEAEMAHIVTPDDSTSVWSADTAGPGFEHIQSVIDSLPGKLSVIERLEAIELLHTYQDFFPIENTISDKHRLWSTQSTCVTIDR